MNSRPHFIFVGAFYSPANGGAGGQLFACQSLMASPIADQIQWTLIDSCADPGETTSRFIRLSRASRRLARFCTSLLTGSVDGVLIFAGEGLSFVEKGTMALLAAALRKRVVFSPRSGLIIDNCKQSALMRLCVRFVLTKCTVVICQSESWRQFYHTLTGLPGDRLRVIGNWIDFSTIPSSKAHHPGQPIKVLYLGWLVRNKGIFDLVEVVRRFRNRLPPIRFVICGDGEARAEITSIIKSNNLESFFDFRGWVKGSEKLECLTSADIYLLLSYREGFPNALLEAMAAGCAVVATKVGAVSELISDGTNGLLVEAGDISSIGESLLRLIQDLPLRHRLSTAGQVHVRATNNISTAWPKVLAALLGERLN